MYVGLNTAVLFYNEILFLFSHRNVTRQTALSTRKNVKVLNLSFFSNSKGFLSENTLFSPQPALKNEFQKLFCWISSHWLPLLLSHHSPQYWGTVPGRLCTGRRYVLPTVCATLGFQFYLVKAPYSTFLSKSFVSAVVFQRNLTHIQCTRTGSDLCSIRSLINPVFPCERSLEGSAGGQRVASILPL